jgi:carboxypeptidase Taq
MMAAQQWAVVTKINPGVSAELEAGNFNTLLDWQRRNIWSAASNSSTPEILEAATGEPLNARYFVEHLRARYG